MSAKFLWVFPVLLAATFSGIYTSNGSTIVKTKTRDGVCLTPYGEVKDGKSIRRRNICEKIECDSFQRLIYHWTCPPPPTHPDEYCFYLPKQGADYPKCCKVTLLCA